MALSYYETNNYFRCSVPLMCTVSHQHKVANVKGSGLTISQLKNKIDLSTKRKSDKDLFSLFLFFLFPLLI